MLGFSACVNAKAQTSSEGSQVVPVEDLAIYGAELEVCEALVSGYLVDNEAMVEYVEVAEEVSAPDVPIILDVKEAARMGFPIIEVSDLENTWRHHIRLVDGTILVMDKRPSPEALDAIEAGCREFPKQMRALARYPSYFLKYEVCQSLVPEFEMIETRPDVYMISGEVVTMEETEAGAIGLPTGEAARPSEGGWLEIAMSEGNVMVGDSRASAAAVSYFEAYCRRKGHGYYSPNPFGRRVLEE